MESSIVREFITFVRINIDLPEAQKVRVWMSACLRGVVEISSFEESSHEACLRAMRLFQKLNVGILIQDHTTVERATVDRDCVAMRLRTRLIPREMRPF